MFCILLLHLLETIVVCSELSSIEKNKDYFLLFIKTTENIDEIQIVHRKIRPPILVDCLRENDFERTVELNKNGSMIFIYKIKINIKKKFYKRHKLEICFYSGKDLICIAKELKFNYEGYFLKTLKFYTPITDLNENEEKLFYEPDRKKIPKNKDNFCIFEMNIPNREIKGPNVVF
ncbi:hypothetical protein NBO_371g0006 [Nosema bombycis CQ1]|uniref:Uncharacterized protein n=1 Tax=Nosema bombycis (strain CQ1 / CVCC 102059) TaxID=578461 RepID=R0KRB5_NOSB1|nr:hypothetical protein NBO_371g0006 [Nosema bombycis CQ1]|eukprot:EOB12752.1 hypothetical protein NBO_371g0006 [Nosema bombycis CQ1]